MAMGNRIHLSVYLLIEQDTPHAQGIVPVCMFPLSPSGIAPIPQVSFAQLVYQTLHSSCTGLFHHGNHCGPVNPLLSSPEQYKSGKPMQGGECNGALD